MPITLTRLCIYGVAITIYFLLLTLLQGLYLLHSRLASVVVNSVLFKDKTRELLAYVKLAMGNSCQLLVVKLTRL